MKTTHTHTPGPWLLDCRDNEAPCIIREPKRPAGSLDEWLAVARVMGPEPYRSSNARVIAAAPELLAALSQAVEESGFSLSGPTDWRAAEDGEPKWVCNARAALAAANGVERGCARRWKEHRLMRERDEREKAKQRMSTV